MIEETKYRGHTIQVWDDDYADNPREWGNLGTLALSDSAWAEEKIGDQEDFFKLLLDDEDYMLWVPEDQDYSAYDIDAEKAQRRIEEKYIVMPVYKYEHGGVAYNTGGFSCPWDSGQNGYIYISKDDARREYSVKRISAKTLAKIHGGLEAEVETFSQAANGEVYGFTILDKDGDTIDSCGGCYGYDDGEGYMMQEARSCIDYAIKKAWKARIATLKTFIKNSVPLNIRQEEFEPILLKGEGVTS
jgi:hypothetical protein